MRAQFVGYDGPAHYMVTISGSTGSPVFMAKGAVEFVRAAAADLRTRSVPPRNRRACHLLATPILGTGGGGARHFAGAVVKEMLPRLSAEAKSLGVDIGEHKQGDVRTVPVRLTILLLLFLLLRVCAAIVTNEPEAYAAAQAQRRVLGMPFPIPAPLRKRAQRLAELALQGKLVFFLGAGISTGAGLPTWPALLEKLASRCGLGRPAPATRAGAGAGAGAGAAAAAGVGAGVGAGAAAAIASESKSEAASSPSAATAAGEEAAKMKADGAPSLSSAKAAVTPPANVGTPAATATGATTTVPPPLTPPESPLAPPPVMSKRQLKREAMRRRHLRAEFEKLNYLDKARVIERRLAEQGVHLGSAVAAELNSPFISVAHALLSAMPCK